MRYIFFLLLASATFSQAPPIEPGVSHELAKWRAVQYSDVRYNLDLTVEKMSPVLKGTMEIKLQVAAVACAEPDCPPRYIVLDWRKIKGSEHLSTISAVKVNGRIAENHPVGETPPPLLGKEGSFLYEERDEHLIFRDGVRMGENVIKLDFTSPILTSGSAITRYVDKEDGAEYIYSLFVPSDASTAFPVFDQPDLKAKYQLAIGVDTNWEVIGNSRHETCLVKEKAGDRRQYVHSFEETQPISTYVFAFAAGPFEPFSKSVGYTSSTFAYPALNAPDRDARRAVDGPPVEPYFAASIYVRKSQAAKFKPHAAEVFRLNREAIKYLEQYFDYKFPFPKHDMVLIPEFPFGGMEHAGATFLRESSIIFPQEPTKNDHISRATLIFHEAAHQWFGDTVTMRWFDDLWLKEGFANFAAYKAMERIMPEMNAWKVFYERVKQAAYQTDSTRGTTAIYQPIANLSAAKSAYGNIVYNKAPAFLRQAEFYLGEDKFQTAVRAFLKKHEFGNAGWEDLVTEFENTRRPGAAKAIVVQNTDDLKSWANQWVTVPGLPIIRTAYLDGAKGGCFAVGLKQRTDGTEPENWQMRVKPLIRFANGMKWNESFRLEPRGSGVGACDYIENSEIIFHFPNYQDYGYGIFLLDEKSREYVLKNIQNEKDPFLRSMMWGALWDSVREAELDPKAYVELAIKNLPTEADETITASVLGRVSTALNYYISDTALGNARASTRRGDLRSRFQEMLLDRLQHAPTPGQRITYYRAFVTNASSARGRDVLKQMLTASGGSVPLKAKDRFDIVMRLATLGDPDAAKLLAGLEKTETGDDAKRYAYAARAGFATAANKAKYWNDFVNNKEISESWIEAAMGPFNSIRASELTLPYLERALNELPNHKRNRKIFFVNGWLGAFIGGQKSEAALDTVNKLLASNPNLDRDLRLKILENVDLIERAVKIRSKYGKN